MNIYIKPSLGAMVTLILILMTITPVLAITINVDGVRETAWAGGGNIVDTLEGAINDNHDLQRIEWTNDTTNFYLLFATRSSPTIWDNPVNPDPILTICLNTDNSATGTALGVCASGAGGYDRYITVVGPPPLTVTVYQNDFATTIGATTNVATATRITELGIDVTSLGLSSGVCGLIPAVVNFAGNIDPDDRVPDTSPPDILMNCGAPTSITLTNLTAQSQTNWTIAGLSSLIALTGILIILRQNRKRIIE